MFGHQPQKLMKMISSIKNRAKSVEVPIKCTYTKLKRVPVERDGYAVSEIQYVEHDCAELSRGVKPIDFSITNLLAVGAYGASAPSYLRSSTDFSFIDSFETSQIS